MKTTLTSNWRPLLRAFYPFLIAIAALWAMPRTAGAQLYVTQGGTGGFVSKYNTTTGALIKAHFITQLNGPTGLAVSGTDLFVAIETANKVGKYNATTGAVINANFITGLHAPFFGLVLNTSARRLFVTNTTIVTNTVGEYNATTGAPINASLITGLIEPQGLAFMGPTPLSSVPFLFVANFGNNTVGKYDAKTGTVINASFITVPSPTGLALLGNTLFVGSFASYTVGAYDATTGAPINASLITGLNRPVGLALLGNNLFVVNQETNNGTVGEYNATTGAAINANFITGLITPVGLAVK
jgi:hypothetical protein